MYSHVTDLCNLDKFSGVHCCQWVLMKRCRKRTSEPQNDFTMKQKWLSSFLNLVSIVMSFGHASSSLQRRDHSLPL